MLTRIQKCLAALLVLCLLAVYLPSSVAAVSTTNGNPPSVEVSPDQSRDVEVQNALIIRGVLLGASALWRMPWFQNMVVTGVRALSGTAAMNAVRNSWFALGRTVDNLIGMDRLTWAVVQDNFIRTISNQGYRSVATQAGVAMSQYFQSLVNFFD